MERKRVDSGTIRSVGYDERTSTLEIEFTGGSVIQYSRVSREVFQRFMNAPTKASFFRDRIEECYTSRRVR